jgi:hypothetical protein
MSIEDRLRSGLAPEGEPPSVDDQVVDRLVDRARRRHRVRVGVGVGAAAAATAIALAALPQVQWNQSDGEPVVNLPTTPTESTETWTFQPQTSPIDSLSWSTRTAQERLWLGSLDGTGLGSYGPPVFARLGGEPVQLSVRYGEATLRIGHLGDGVRFTWSGTYEVSGRKVTFDWPELGTSTFEWKARTTDLNKEMSLAFVSAEGPDQFGAPVEVFLRMALTSYPFTTREGFGP